MKRDWNFIETPSLTKPGWKEDRKSQPLSQHLHGYSTQNLLLESESYSESISAELGGKDGCYPLCWLSAARGQERKVNWVGAGSEKRSRMETKKKKMEENPEGQ